MNPDYRLTVDRFHRPFYIAPMYQNFTTVASAACKGSATMRHIAKCYY
jgi:hypothetical protein